MKELQALLNGLEHSARVALGCWSDARVSGHNGLAAFFLYEEAERRKDFLKIANHIAGCGQQRVIFDAIPPAVKSDYATCIDATFALFNCYENNLRLARKVVDRLKSGGHDVYFMSDFVKKLEYELAEVKRIWTLLKDTAKESLPEVNKRLLSEYG